MVPGMNRPLSLLLLLMLLCIGSSVKALMFESAKLSDGRTVLLLHDCSDRNKKNSCKKYMTMFYRGDADRLSAHLSSHRYDEIWLWSGGGNLDEGVKVGEVLRRFQATVRVPNGKYCISACTVAFMGGLFRFVDKEATYEVHAYSRYSGELRPKIRRLLLSDPEGTLYKIARDEYADARNWAIRLMAHFQIGVRGKPDYAKLQAWKSKPRGRAPYLSSARFKRDVERLRNEGVAAAQEILMRIERDAMQQAIDELREHESELGSRAVYGLDMLQAMFTSRITLTASLSQETLLKMGYITRMASR